MAESTSARARRIASNLADVRERMDHAAQRGGRTAGSVRLVAVSKYADVADTLALVAAGCHDLGESRPQALWQKAEALADAAVRWHLVGHLQRNKIARTLPLCSVIHSVDSQRLLATLNTEAEKLQRRAAVLLEVNVSGDAAKHGFEPSALEPLLDHLQAASSLDVRGLMCMAAREGDLPVARRNFEQLRQLRDRLRAAWAGCYDLPELSMGMSGDYEVAIEEGATLVRIGSALFE